MILVTGASGNVGKEIVNCLERRQIAFRVGARKPASIPTRAGVAAVPFDFLNASTYATAVAGCDAVFLLRPPAISNTKRTLNVFLNVARAHGVAHVVFVSVAGAADNPLVPHHAVEMHLRSGPEGWTILRPGFFAQNLGDAYRDDIRCDNRIFVPAGAGRVAFVDVRDVAEVAVNALTDPLTHRGQIYTLTGPEALSFTAVASILSDELARIIQYQHASIPAYFAHLIRHGLAPMQILVQTILHVGLRFGQAEAVSESLANLLGRRPHTMRDYVRDHRSLWM